MSSAQMRAAAKAKLELGSKARTGGCPGTEPWTQSQGPCMSAPCRVSHQSQGRQGQTSQGRAVPPITKGRVISRGPGAVQAGGAGPAAQGGLWRGQQEPGHTGPALAGSSCQARPRLQPRSYAMGEGIPAARLHARCPLSLRSSAGWGLSDLDFPGTHWKCRLSVPPTLAKSGSWFFA